MFVDVGVAVNVVAATVFVDVGFAVNVVATTDLLMLVSMV